MSTTENIISHPLAVSFTEPARLLGVEVKLLVLNLVIGFYMFAFVKILWFPALTFALHFILQWVTAAEPKMREIYIKYQFQGDCYEPWGGLPSSNNKRPIGFGRDESC